MSDSTPTPSQDFSIRPFSAADSVEELTKLLHAAYRPLGDLGLNYSAVNQTPDETMKRVNRGKCFVASKNKQLIGTIVFHGTAVASGCPWYDRADVSNFAQFGVHPDYQAIGVGRRLLKAVEAQAIETGAREIALDTAEQAAHLVNWYRRNGYRFIDYMQSPGKTFRSVVLSKSLACENPNIRE